jgi:hypothetical protein
MKTAVMGAGWRGLSLRRPRRPVRPGAEVGVISRCHIPGAVGPECARRAGSGVFLKRRIGEKGRHFERG